MDSGFYIQSIMGATDKRRPRGFSCLTSFIRIVMSAAGGIPKSPCIACSGVGFWKRTVIIRDGKPLCYWFQTAP